MKKVFMKSLYKHLSKVTAIFIVSLCIGQALMAAEVTAKPAVDLKVEYQKLKTKADSLRKTGKLDAYGNMRVMLVERFLKYLEIDRANEREDLVSYAERNLEKILKEENSRLAAIQSGKLQPMAVPKISMKGNPKVVGGHLEHQVIWPDGKKQNRPVMLFGFGVFSGMRKDIEWLGQLGINFCQTEIGPRHLWPEEGKWNKKLIKDFSEFFEKARKNDVRVDLLLSPHYMPNWQFKCNPDWKAHMGGFMNYAYNRPGVYEFLYKTTWRLLKETQNYDNIWSICLANEPVAFRSVGDKDTKRLYIEYLKDRYKTIENVNKQWETKYKSFNEVPVYYSNTMDYYAPDVYDWMRFNDQRFASFMASLGKPVKKVAPEKQTHIKMIHRLFGKFDMIQGVDVDQFQRIGTLNGHDGGARPIDPTDEPEFALVPDKLLFANAFIRGIRKKPILNTEDHILIDRSTNDIFSGHARAALWIEAITGTSGSVAWAWERKDNIPREPFVGLFQYRPGATEEYMRTGFDLMRVMDKVAAIADAPAKVALLYSKASILRNPNAAKELISAFKVINSIGVPVTVISEGVLMRGELDKLHPEVKILVLAGTSHISNDAFDGLSQWAKDGFHKGKSVIRIGKDSAFYDEYCRPRSLELFNDTAVAADKINLIADKDKLARKIKKKIKAYGVSPEYKLVDVKTSKPIKGVYFRTAKHGDAIVATAVNCLAKPITCKWIDRKGNVKVFKDELPLQMQKEVKEFELKPLQVLCGNLKEKK